MRLPRVTHTPRIPADAAPITSLLTESPKCFTSRAFNLRLFKARLNISGRGLYDLAISLVNTAVGRILVQLSALNRSAVSIFDMM